MPKYGPQIVTDGLVLCLDAASTKSYPGSGTTWYDCSTSNYNATLSAQSTYNFANRGGIAFDGASDYGYTTGMSYTPYCTEIWFHNDIDITKDPKPGGGYEMILGMDDYPGGISCRGFTSAATDETICFFGKGASTWSNYGLSYIRDNIYVGNHSLILNWNGSNYDFWLDGSKKTVYSHSNYGHLTLVTRNSLFLAKEDGTVSYYFNGTIYRVAIYSSQLTDAQVMQNFNATRGRFGI